VSKYLKAKAIRKLVGSKVIIHRHISKSLNHPISVLHGKLLTVHEYENARVPIGGELETNRGYTAIDLSRVLTITLQEESQAGTLR
jgi:hypothetical protein